MPGQPCANRGLDHPRPGEDALRELKLLVDHRDDLVDERRRASNGCAGNCTTSTRTLTVPPGALDRTVWLDRVARRLRRAEQTVQIRIARELVGRCRSLTRTILALDRELQARTERARAGLLALPGCGAFSAAKLLGEIGPIERFNTDAQLARHAGVAPLKQAPASINATASTAAATANSTAPCTESRSPKRASTRPHAPTSSANRTKAKAAAKHSAASNDNSPAPSTPPSKTSQH